MIPESQWKWLGMPGHYCCASKCQFHLVTVIGEYVISTIGAREKAGFYVEIGDERTFETYVFPSRGIEPCECCVDKDYNEIESQGYNSPTDAQRGHYELCYKYAEKQNDI